MKSHTKTWLSIDEIGGVVPPYLPNFNFSSSHIDTTHQSIGKTPLKDGFLVEIRNHPLGQFGPDFEQAKSEAADIENRTGNVEVESAGNVIPGWLRREDALKLYELAYFSQGNILELGSFHGLSTSILANACKNAPTPKQVETIDLDPGCTAATKANLEGLGLLDYVTIHTGDATVLVKDCISAEKKFGFVFIDHSHEYQPCLDVCQLLADVTVPGGFCLFHDFNDKRNRDPENSDYGVYQAVQHGLDKEKFKFYGIYGCTGLYRRVEDRSGIASWVGGLFS